MLLNVLWVVFSFLLCLLSSLITLLIVYAVVWKRMKKQMKKMADEVGTDIFENAMPIVEDEIINKMEKSTVVDEFLRVFVQSLKKTFASQDGLFKRRQNSISKKVITHILGDYPVAKLLIEELELMDKLVADPRLLLWGMETLPWAFKSVQDYASNVTPETQSLNPSNSINPTVNQYGQGTPQEIRQNGLQKGLESLQGH